MGRYPVRRKITIVKEYYEYGKISGDDFEDAKDKYERYFFPDKNEDISNTCSKGEFELLDNEFIGYSQTEIDEVLKDRDMYSKINSIMDEFNLDDYDEENLNRIKSIFLEKHGREIYKCETEDCDAWGYRDEMIVYGFDDKVAHKNCVDTCYSCGQLEDKWIIDSHGLCERCL